MDRYITVQIPCTSIHFSDLLKEEVFHNHPEKINDEFMNELTSLIVQELERSEIVIGT